MDAFPWLKKIMLGLGGLLVIYIGIGLIRTEASLDGGKDVNQPFLKDRRCRIRCDMAQPTSPHRWHHDVGSIQGQRYQRGDLPFILGFTSASFIWFNGLAIASFARAKINTRALTWLNPPLRRCDHLLRNKAAFRIWQE